MMNKHVYIVLMLISFGNSIVSQTKLSGSVMLYPDSAKQKISKHIYGQFSEHLGSCIYGGIWVGENSPIPNTRGIRNDVVAALKKVKVPCLRWPGGCFADGYHWKDGIGPRSRRPKSVNTTWGGVTEDNSFGTHEFMDLCEQIGTEPMICGNIGSGTVEEMAEWVEYLTSDAETPMALLRKNNGKEKPWTIKFWCVGNETWGCGGIMSAEHYSNELARYSYFLKNYGQSTLYKIASGGLPEDYRWTETIMKKWSTTDGWLQGYMNGYSLHYYTVCNNWEKKGSATGFTEEDWFTTMSKTLQMDSLIVKHSVIMDKYDPQKKIGLSVDEWGNWHDVEPGTNPGFLFQQNTLRDAIVASLNLDIFNKYCDRVKVANIAQMVNVLQALILTENEKMVLTPTYHVFDLYAVHHEATYVPFALSTDNYSFGEKEIPALSATASRDSNGLYHLTLTNVHSTKEMKVRCSVNDTKIGKISGRILTSKNMQDHNTFAEPGKVSIQPFKRFTLSGNDIEVEMPAKSIITLEIKR